MPPNGAPAAAARPPRSNLTVRTKLVRVSDYDPAWPARFEALRARLAPAAAGLAVVIEHVGSTAVPGLAAKPVLDIDIVIRNRQDFPELRDRLAGLGYRHLGNLDVEDREAFEEPPDDPAHNLYVSSQTSECLRNHLTVRDHLRRHPGDAARYADLKRRLAAEFPEDVNRYAEAKTEFILEILAKYEFPEEAVRTIRRINHRPAC